MAGLAGVRGGAGNGQEFFKRQVQRHGQLGERVQRGVSRLTFDVGDDEHADAGLLTQFLLGQIHCPPCRGDVLRQYGLDGVVGFSSAHRLSKQRARADFQSLGQLVDGVQGEVDVLRLQILERPFADMRNAGQGSHAPFALRAKIRDVAGQHVE